MIPAEVKKRENIAEYIVHMYQTEDLISNYEFNLDDILEFVIKHMSKDENELKELLLWYAGLIEQMKLENLPVPGRRLSSTQQYVDKLGQLHHSSLLNSNEYKEIFKKAEEDISMQMKLAGGQITDPVQICLNAIYGKLIINLNGKKLPTEHELLVEKFGKVLAYLAKQYHKSE